jgi:hypothetical protein
MVDPTEGIPIEQERERYWSMWHDRLALSRELGQGKLSARRKWELQFQISEHDKLLEEIKIRLRILVQKQKAAEDLHP